MKKILFSLFLLLVLFFALADKSSLDGFKKLNSRAVSSLLESPVAVEVFSLDSYSAVET